MAHQCAASFLGDKKLKTRPLCKADVRRMCLKAAVRRARLQARGVRSADCVERVFVRNWANHT